MSTEATKQRVFARVAGREYVPTETVEIKPGEQIVPEGVKIVPEGMTVVPQLNTGLWTNFGTFEVPIDIDGSDGSVTYTPLAMRQYEQAETRLPAHLGIPDYEFSRPLPTASDMGALGYALAVESSPVPIAEPVCLQDEPLATGGVIEPLDEPLLVGEGCADYFVPNPVTEKLAPSVHSVQAPPADIAAADLRTMKRHFKADLENNLNTQLDEVLDPDTRALHFESPYPAEVGGEPEEAQVVDNIHEKDHTFMDHIQSVGRDNGIPHPVAVTEPTDYERAAELGTSVHMLRWVKRELLLVEGHIQIARQQAIAETLGEVVSVLRQHLPPTT